MKTIGIKLADGSFYPVLKEGAPNERILDLTTAHNNQTKVMVDLYRSAKCSMEDAEYVDSLQIENLVEHPNGEPDISFTVSIDKDNRLSARMFDAETGKQSNATITLVSRTLEERLKTDDYSIADNPTMEGTLSPDSETENSEPVKKAAKAVAGGGLLAAASALLNNENKEKETSPEADKTDVDVIEETEMPVEDTSISEEEAKSLSEEVALSDEPAASDDTAAISDEPAASDDTAAISDEQALSDDAALSSDLPDMDFDLPDVTQAAETADATEEAPLDTSLDLPDFNEPVTDSAFDTTDVSFDEPAADSIADEPVISEDAPLAAEETAISDDLPSFDEPAASDDTAAISDEQALSDDTAAISDEPALSDDAALSSDLPDMDFDLPDVTQAAETADATEEAPLDTSLDLPDFNEPVTDSAFDTTDVSFDEPAADSIADEPVISEDAPLAAEETAISDDLPSFDEPKANDLSIDLDLPDLDEKTFSDSLPDFDEPVTETAASTDEVLNFDEPAATEEISDSDNNLPDFDSLDDNAMPKSGGISFTGLYDKETELGNSSSYSEDDYSKKTKAPVIICVICAVICILATALVLFIIPSKYNLFSKGEKTAKEEVVTEIEEQQPAAEEQIAEPIPEPAPEPVPEAKEDEVVIVEKAEEVVPEQPPVKEEKPKNITYKIKWGDTLWDIADTYYKNPWRYKYIARFNGIKDPDYIISGTYITIPAQ